MGPFDGARSRSRTPQISDLDVSQRRLAAVLAFPVGARRAGRPAAPSPRPTASSGSSAGLRAATTTQSQAVEPMRDDGAHDRAAGADTPPTSDLTVSGSVVPASCRRCTSRRPDLGATASRTRGGDPAISPASKSLPCGPPPDHGTPDDHPSDASSCRGRAPRRGEGAAAAAVRRIGRGSPCCRAGAAAELRSATAVRRLARSAPIVVSGPWPVWTTVVVGQGEAASRGSTPRSGRRR